MKKHLILFFIFAASIAAKAQMSLSYYPLSSYIGISTNLNHRVWADFRILTNTFISNTNMEILPMFNIKKDSMVKIYAGAGVNFNLIYGFYTHKYINGYTLNFGTRVSPFSKVPNFSFIAEFSPYMNETFVGATLRTSLGIAWIFGNTPKQKK